MDSSIFFIVGAVIAIAGYLSVSTGNRGQYGGKASSRKNRRSKTSNNKTRHR